ncbi:MAG TPA: hypothetical protein VM097_05250 [Mycobacteriales bacterium]|nr:hypothetical protein [Mycobacteriales bacterium]
MRERELGFSNPSDITPQPVERGQIAGDITLSAVGQELIPA